MGIKSLSFVGSRWNFSDVYIWERIESCRSLLRRTQSCLRLRWRKQSFRRCLCLSSEVLCRYRCICFRFFSLTCWSAGHHCWYNSSRKSKFLVIVIAVERFVSDAFYASWTSSAWVTFLDCFECVLVKGRRKYVGTGREQCFIPFKAESTLSSYFLAYIMHSKSNQVFNKILILIKCWYRVLGKDYVKILCDVVSDRWILRLW